MKLELLSDREAWGDKRKRRSISAAHVKLANQGLTI